MWKVKLHSFANLWFLDSLTAPWYELPSEPALSAAFRVRVGMRFCKSQPFTIEDPHTFPTHESRSSTIRVHLSMLNTRLIT